VTPAASEGSSNRNGYRWLGPMLALLVFSGVVYVLHREMAHLHMRSVFAHLHGIPRSHVVAALDSPP